MTIEEAIRLRHTVRRYTGEPVSDDIKELLNGRIAENNRENNLNLEFVTGNADGLSGMAKLMGRGINSYIILAGPDDSGLDEKLGYCGADLILYAQTLGLNTWWVGGMYSDKGARRNLSASARVNGVLAVGYGQNQGTPHKSKSAAEISSYEGEAPQWFNDGIEALLYAPTAMNRQAFKVTGKGNKVAISCDNGRFSGIDLGIGKYHFEVGAGRDNFEWSGEI